MNARRLQSLVTVLLAAGALLGPARPMAAQPGFEVKDINPTRTDIPTLALLGTPMRIVGGVVYFVYDDFVHGPELWRYDPVGGASLVLDICPGACSSAPRGLTPLDGVLYFIAGDGSHGQELWRSDGTAAGTTMVKDINPGLGDGVDDLFADTAHHILYLNANDGVHGRELWKSDGTPAGTVMVKDINPGPGDSAPSFGTAGNGVVLFNAADGVHGREPWTTDGTAGGTSLLADINAGSASSVYSWGSYIFGTSALFLPQAAAPGTFVFAADDGLHGSELWASDGTPGGTRLVLDIEPGSYGSSPDGLAVLGSTAYFTANDRVHGWELWKSDGTAAGTVMVADINPGPGSSNIYEITALGSQILFHASHDGSLVTDELWESDGTPAGTALVKSFDTGGFFSPRGLYGWGRAGNALLFSAPDPQHGFELWKTDGSATGTVLVADIYPGPISSLGFALAGFASDGTNALFLAYDPQGLRLWRSDGTAAGTAAAQPALKSASSLAVGASSFLFGVPPGVHAGSAFFAASDASGHPELWKSDGTAAGTTLVKDFGAQGGFPSQWLDLGSSLLFVQGGLWSTDGTTAGTQPLGGYGNEYLLKAFKGMAYYADYDSQHGTELWRSDGTAGGTGLFADLAIGTDSSYPSLLTPSGAALFFTATTNASGYELWKTDGTQAGTAQVKDILPGAGSSYPTRLTDVAGTLFFFADDGIHGRELWKSDGTPAGTALIKDIHPGAGSSDPVPWGVDFGETLTAALGGNLYFVAGDGTSGEELWRSDGTPGGTFLVLDINPGAAGSQPRELTVAGGKLFFVADDGVHGRELWVSDGSAAGTHLVSDILPGAASSLPQALTAVAGRLVFSATDLVHGRELWVSDGTAAGTRLLQDIAPGPAPASPMGFTVAGPYLFFGANDGVTGWEPWALLTTSLDGFGYHTLPPCRLFDSRGGPPLAAGVPRTITAGGACGIPATAGAIAVNLTAAGATAAGHLVSYAAGVLEPVASTLNFRPGLTRASNAVQALGGGAFVVIPHAVAGGQVDLIVDVAGWFE
jgi:ELWxxDGT repeat protein